MHSPVRSATRSSTRCGASRTTSPSRGWREHIPTVLLRLFQHRQVEFLLRPFNEEHSIPDGWTGLHAAYRYAESAGMLHQPVVARRCHEELGEQSTLEQEYIHVLLLELLNGGHLALRSVLAEPADPSLVRGAFAANGTCPRRGRQRRSSLPDCVERSGTRTWCCRAPWSRFVNVTICHGPWRSYAGSGNVSVTASISASNTSVGTRWESLWTPRAMTSRRRMHRRSGSAGAALRCIFGKAPSLRECHSRP